MSRSALEKQMLKQLSQQRLAAMSASSGVVGSSYPGYHAAAGYAPFPAVPSAGGLHADTSEEDGDETRTQSKANALPIHGNSSTFNINNLLFNNIKESPYFHALYQLRTYHEVIDEIRRSVRHVEPWETGTSRYPSSAFCLLVKFMLMKLTVKQMNGLLNLDDSPLVRAIGLLYLRYTCPPADLWHWFEPFLEDPEEFQPGSDPSSATTMGSYCIKLLTEMQYFATTLPRIPVPIERKIKVLLLLLDEKKQRRVRNQRAVDAGKLVKGTKLQAIYGDAENEPAWYDAVLDSREGDKWWVTFPEYGNTELVDLGDLKLPQDILCELESRSSRADHVGSDRGSREDRYRYRDRQRSKDCRRSESRDRERANPGGSRGGGGQRRRDSRDRNRGSERSHRGSRSRSRSQSWSRSRSRSRSRDGVGKSGIGSSLMEKVLQSEREASAAVGRNYAQRPASYKGSLSLKLDRYTARRPSEEREGRRKRSRSRSPPARPAETTPPTAAGGGGASQSSEAQQQRLKLLKEKYGDASASVK